MQNLFNDLNEEQKKAVEYIDGPVIIFAGAGTGKTRVITYRIAYLLSLGINPWNILAVTFTNKAAEEMKSRVIKLVPGKGEAVWISTFHSFCARFLRREAESLGLKNNFVIYDEDDQKRVIKDCMKELMISDRELSVDLVREMIGRAKDNLLDSESYKINSFVFPDPFREIIAEIYFRYQKRLERSSALDFGDLLMKTVESFRTNIMLKEKYAEKFRYIHIDEYQDVNLAQAVLAKQLSYKHNNICVVGDDDQSIYSWRGADASYLLNFKKEFPDAKEFKLERNYRSTKIILDIGNTLISYNRQRAKKSLWTENNNCSTDDIKIIKVKTEYEEAEYITEEIKKMFNGNHSANTNEQPSVAVFYRMNAQSRVFEEVFQANNLPYKIVGAVGFYERQEIKDIIAYLKIIVNPDDDISLKRIINVPARNISDTTILYLETLAKEQKTSLWQQIIKIDETELSLRAKNAVWRFLALYDIFKKYKDTMFPSEFIKFLIDKTGYLKMLQSRLETHNDPHDFDRLTNIEELISAAKNYESQDNVTTIEEFLTKVSLMTETDNEKDNLIDMSTVNHQQSTHNQYVTLMTLHSAKGLEFDVVFITGLEERIFPVWWAVKGQRMSSENRDGIEEERRLCYVGITRAKKKLYFTYSETRRIWGVETHLRPSQFIKEILNFFEPVTTKTSRYFSEKGNNKNDNAAVITTETEDKNIKINNLRLGELVHHEKFGVGKVMDILRDPYGDKIVVLFSDGEKRKLHLEYANLRKV